MNAICTKNNIECRLDKFGEERGKALLCMPDIDSTLLSRVEDARLKASVTFCR
jgi:hypothetical protein